jgi:hypothetical protein
MRASGVFRGSLDRAIFGGSRRIAFGKAPQLPTRDRKPRKDTTVKFKALALALFVAGACTSFAVADDGHGKGKKPTPSAASTTVATSTTGATTTTSRENGKGKDGTDQADKKVTLCHKAGKSGRWVKITVSKNAAKAKLKHGDVAPDASGKCPARTTTTTEGTATTTQ